LVFRPLADSPEASRGIVFTSPRSLLCAVGTIGVDIDRLDSLRRDRPPDEALADQVHWLQP
jgi:hypothetical protein